MCCVLENKSKMKGKRRCSPGRDASTVSFTEMGSGYQKSQWFKDAISHYDLVRGRPWAPAAVPPPARSLCVAHPRPRISAGSSRCCFLTYLFLKLGFSLWVFIKSNDRSSSSNCCDGKTGRGGGEREGGRWRGRRAAPIPLGPASHFYGCTETIPFPNRAPELLVYHTHAHQKLSASQSRLSKGNTAGFIPDHVFQSQLFNC